LHLRSPLALPWPLPAVAGWALAWGVAAALGGPAGFAAGALSGLAAAALASGTRRRLIVGAGFPMSALALGAPGLPAWAWLAAAAALALAYPLKAWRDAPFFPTPAAALDGLDAVVDLPPSPRILDAGCGAGDGLAALARVWPDARLEGIECSRPLAWLARRRCAGATVRRADLWAGDWSGFDLVYLFQRPETMERAIAKAEREMRRGSWLVSLEFELPQSRRIEIKGRKPVFARRTGGSTAAPLRR
jgi:hypothetical protein